MIKAMQEKEEVVGSLSEMTFAKHECCVCSFAITCRKRHHK